MPTNNSNDNKEKVNREKIKKDVQILNKVFHDTVTDMDEKLFGGSSDIINPINAIKQKLPQIMTNELDSMKSNTGEDVGTFLVKFLNQQGNTNISDITELMETESEGLYNSFQQQYKNKNILYGDLEMLCKHLYELEEAVMTVRDSIVSADDMTKSISRSIFFKSYEGDSLASSYISTLEKMEKEYNLTSKIKNHIVPNTLKLGNYYVYTCPYKVLMEEYQKRILKNNKLSSTTLESSFIEIENNLTNSEKKEYKELLNNENLKNIEIITDDIPIPLVENVDMSIFSDQDAFKNMVSKETKSKKKKINGFADGVHQSTVEEELPEMSKCYIKYVDPRRMSPVKIMDVVLGYLYVHGDIVEQPVLNQFGSIDINVAKKENNRNFFTKIVDQIVKSFNKKFLEDNIKFKDLILDALMYYDVMNKKVKFQFIPKEYIVEFKINEDINGDGNSMLINTMFYAKLYLALLMFKMMSVISHSNDQKVIYVRNSGIDANISNSIQSVARSIKSKDMSWADLMNFQYSMGAKGVGKTLFVPTGKSGERGVEFDILAGQDVQLNTDFMEMLRNFMFNATGVPSALMNYLNEVDYAKTLEMANMKFMSRVMSYQMDFDKSLTELYKKIIEYSDIKIEKKYIKDFHFVLNKPKSLGIANLNEYISNAEQVAQAEIRVLLGENSDDEDINQLKDLYFKESMKDKLQMIDWKKSEDILEKAKLLLKLEKQKKGSSEEGGEESF